jgi:hypothetical protein
MNRLFTVWEFRGVTVPQAPAVVVRVAEQDDLRSQHEYQRALAQVWASSRAEALAQVAR